MKFFYSNNGIVWLFGKVIGAHFGTGNKYRVLWKYIRRETQEYCNAAGETIRDE